MTERRNFDPREPDASYLHDHIKFRVFVEVDLHNVGSDFALVDARTWLAEALERGLKAADPNDRAKVIAGSAKLISRPKCECYKEEAEALNEPERDAETMK